MVTCFFSKSTFTFSTPFTADSFSVTALAQPWHFIPVISYVFDMILSFLFHEEMIFLLVLTIFFSLILEHSVQPILN